MAERTKIAILGGGMSGIAAAFELTDPSLPTKYDVTLYQLGHRLGGKGASGRNPAFAQRIEEHGLHVWFGFYENAFRSMRKCYEELDRPKDAPLATLEQAFLPSRSLVLYENFRGRWIPWEFTVPRNDEVPGEGEILLPFSDLAKMFLEWLGLFFKKLVDDDGALPFLPTTIRESSFLRSFQNGSGFFGVDRIREFLGFMPPLPQSLVELDPFRSLLDSLRSFLDALGLADYEKRIRDFVRRLRSATGVDLVLDLEDVFAHAAKVGEPLEEPFCAGLTRFRDALWKYYVEPRVDDDDLRLLFTMFDTLASVVCGVMREDLLTHGFDAINDVEISDWLRKHGAQEVTIEQGLLIRGGYDMAFAFENGDVTKPNMAAGACLRALLRLIGSYKGGFYYKMQGGMGDVVFAPYYEVLKRRGVKFKFFHSVTRLGLSADKKSIETIEVVPQVALADGRESYEPLVVVKGLPSWPSHPDWSQLEGGSELAGTVDFEKSLNPLGAKPITLRRGEKNGFDLVVLAIPVGALKPICAELVADRANPRFRAMIDNSKTTMTQAFQLWMNGELRRDLGWILPSDNILCSYVDPLDTWANMSHLIAREDWLETDQVENISYFCGVLKDVRGDSPEKATARTKRLALQFLDRSTLELFPGARHAPGSKRFNYNLLVDRLRRSGKERFEAQYWRANSQPWERYVLTPAGSVKHRLKTDESGYDNLFLAGDWIKNGLDSGCIESAVMGGMQAARAICGRPKRIVGENDEWLRFGDGPPGESETRVAGKTARGGSRNGRASIRRLRRDPDDATAVRV